MKTVFISFSICSLVVAALFQELGGKALFTSTTGAMQVKVAAASAANSEPLPQGLAQRFPAAASATNSAPLSQGQAPRLSAVESGQERLSASDPVVFDLNASCTNRSVIFTERTPEVFTSDVLKIQVAKSRTRRGPLYPEGAKVKGEGDIFLFLSHGEPEANDAQKMMVRLPSGQTVLVVHDVTRAPAVANVRLGDRIAFSGTYTYGLNGDEINQTCRLEEKTDSGGWIRHNGKVYQ